MKESIVLESDVRRILDGTPIVHLATVCADGSPHAVPVWIGTRGEDVVFLTGPDSVKARNLRRDPRLALSLVDPDDAFRPVVLRGRVTRWLEGDDAWAVADGLADKYYGGTYSREQERVVAIVGIERQRVGLG